MRVPSILVVAPPPIAEPKGPIAPKFDGARQKSVGLAAAYEAMARDRHCEFFEAASVTATSAIDGVHLDADQHRSLGTALARVVSPLLANGNA